MQHVRRGSSYQSRRGWHDEIYSLCRSTIVYRLKPSPRNGTTATPPRESLTAHAAPRASRWAHAICRLRSHYTRTFIDLSCKASYILQPVIKVLKYCTHSIVADLHNWTGSVAAVRSLFSHPHLYNSCIVFSVGIIVWLVGLIVFVPKPYPTHNQSSRPASVDVVDTHIQSTN